MNRETDSSLRSQETTLNSIRGKHMFMVISWNATTSLFWWYTDFLPFSYIAKYIFNTVLLNVQRALSVYPTKPYGSSSTQHHHLLPCLALPCEGTLFRKLLHFSPCSLKMFISLVQATMHSGTCLSVSNVSAHVKVSLSRPRTGAWALVAHSFWL